jgi:hypothetical protein
MNLARTRSISHTDYGGTSREIEPIGRSPLRTSAPVTGRHVEVKNGTMDRLRNGSSRHPGFTLPLDYRMTLLPVWIAAQDRPPASEVL